MEGKVFATLELGEELEELARRSTEDQDIVIFVKC